jgi:hypothetical protein
MSATPTAISTSATVTSLDEADKSSYIAVICGSVVGICLCIISSMLAMVYLRRRRVNPKAVTIDLTLISDSHHMAIIDDSDRVIGSNMDSNNIHHNDIVYDDKSSMSSNSIREDTPTINVDYHETQYFVSSDSDNEFSSILQKRFIVNLSDGSSDDD